MIGDRIKEARKNAQHTQNSLAELINTHPKNISRWEAGEYTPEAETVGILAKALNVSADYLLGLTDNPKRATRESDLSPDEIEIIMALRRGDVKSALRVIALE
jgi:transcriptional regulator with XRE-family HTH domain